MFTCHRETEVFCNIIWESILIPCADIKYGIAFGATTDLILLSKAIQPT